MIVMRTNSLLVCIILFSAISCLAQKPLDNFLTYYQQQDSIRHDFWQNKQFGKAIGVLKDMHGRYKALDSVNRVGKMYVDASIMYNLACGYALIDSVDQSLRFLKISVDEGFSDYNNMKRDSDLVSLWDTKSFRELLAIVQERGDCLVALRNAGNYRSALPSRPLFTYQQAKDSNLIRLRTMYRLDSVAGSENDISRIIRLMQWAHTIVRHDGQSENPRSRNAIDLIAVCNNEHRGVNCRMMATILNEAYLSMGFQSRHITCMPKDTSDTDCHVINIVYSNTLRKWVWMDPTFQVFMTDKAGTLLSIAEVREKMISGDSVYVSDGANWNGQPYDKENYLNYMAKNLYWFMCPAVSEFGYESKDGRKTYVNLLPLSYNPHGKLMEAMNEKGGYYTNDADYFWNWSEKQ
jgi:hypothetical protein